MISLQRLRYFVAVAEELHFTRAARRVYVDQGALSCAIRQLERDLGAPLFNRSSRRVELTTFGASLLPEVCDLLSRTDRLGNRADAATRRRSADRTLRIGLLGAPGLALFEILRQLHLSAPHIEVATREIGFSSFSPGLADGTLDGVFMYSPPRPNNGYRVIPLWENGYGICISHRHKMADSTALSVRDIIDEPFRPPEPGEDLAQYSAATLRATRGTSAPTCSGWIPSSTVYETFLQTASRSDIIAATNSTLLSCRPIESYGLKYIAVDDAPRSITCLAVSHHPRKTVNCLTRAAQKVATGIGRIIPRTWPHPNLPQPGATSDDASISLSGPGNFGPRRHSA